MENNVSKEQLAFLKKHKHYHHKIIILRFTILIIFLIIWEISVRAGKIDSFFFSSPTELYQKALDYFADPAFWNHTWVTFYETLLSFLLVTLFSLITGFLLWRFALFSQVIEPYLVILNSLPKSALAPLLIVWLGTGVNTIIVAGISVALFGSVVNFYYAFKSCDPGKIVLIRTLGGSNMQCFAKVVFPGAVPMLFSASKVNIGLSLVGVIIGEFLAGRRGLGYLIIYGSQVFLLSQVIFCIILLCIMAFLLYRILQYAEHKIKIKMGL